MHCVDLGESFPTHIYLQNFASIPPRTSPLKFARSSGRRQQDLLPGLPPGSRNEQCGLQHSRATRHPHRKAMRSKATSKKCQHGECFNERTQKLLEKSTKRQIVNRSFSEQIAHGAWAQLKFSLKFAFFGIIKLF